MRKIFLIFFILIGKNIFSQQLWHDKERTLRYHPEGNDIVIENGEKRFNRALYGGNTAFRAEAGDLPEFALYMPGMGGNLKFGIIANGRSRWLIDAKYIKASYRAGSMLYEIKDELLGNGQIFLQAIATYDDEALILKIQLKNINSDVELVAVFGGATGKKFSRDGDIGADPESSFYLKPEYCTDNFYKIDKNSFSLLYGFSKPLSDDERYEVQHLPGNKINDTTSDKAKKIYGVFPLGMNIAISSANSLQNPLSVFDSSASSSPVIASRKKLQQDEELFFLIGKQDSDKVLQADIKKKFDAAESERKKLAERIKISTPDTFINTLGPVLGIAADAIWEDPSFMHGAVAWRMRLNGWRGAYVADVFGWHDRAKKHFSSYALSQIKDPLTGPVVADTALHLARQLEKLGTSLFSSGYISRNPGGDLRAHHYDMNLVFVDQLLNHFNWTGDTNYVREMLPLIKRHLAWEKRNFDADGDGLYDAYAAIWASDALQYSGGGVTHSSAYNYRCNKVAAQLARMIGEDGTAYEKESSKILNAINKKLWMADEGWYAEYKDLLGNQLLHTAAGLWTIYHAIDEGIADPFQAYQSLKYIDNHIPHIPIKAKGLNDTSLYTISTTNWQPYTWSLNNVALAEVLHTALAYWQGGRYEEAYRLWKSNLIESMYMGSSPGNIQQLSFYDAIRGELYRDFADPIAMAGRTLVEGLFGIQPDVLNNKLIIKPGFPSNWDHASIEAPDIIFDFKRNESLVKYFIKQNFSKLLSVKLILPAWEGSIKAILANGKNIKWKSIPDNVGMPLIEIDLPPLKNYEIEILWAGDKIINAPLTKEVTNGKNFTLNFNGVKLFKVYDPQKVVNKILLSSNTIKATANDKPGARTIFIKVAKESFTWWQPVHLNILPKSFKFKTEESITISTIGPQYEKIDLSHYFNDKVTNIFKNQYLSPRPSVPTLQLPTQGIGNWAYPMATANIVDSGLRKRAGASNEIITSDSIAFRTPSDFSANNILFTSMWDNYPDSATIPLSGKSSHAYFLLAGSTDPMQSRVINGEIVIHYKDGSSDKLELKNPVNWWPIEQDYYADGFAFTTGEEKPLRLYLKSGIDTRDFKDFVPIRGFSNFGIDGGAATFLDLPLDKKKELKSLVIRSIANDVVIGLMALTLVR